MVESVTVPCQECGVELAGDSPDLRLELTCDDEPIVYCVEGFEREFGEQSSRPHSWHWTVTGSTMPR